MTGLFSKQKTTIQKIKLKSNFKEEFIDMEDVMAWAIRGKHIERALDNAEMDYIEDGKKK